MNNAKKILRHAEVLRRTGKREPANPALLLGVAIHEEVERELHEKAEKARKTCPACETRWDPGESACPECGSPIP